MNMMPFNPFRRIVAGSAYDADAAIDIAAVEATGALWGTTTPNAESNKLAYSNLIAAWKANGVYSPSNFYRVLAGPVSLDGAFACGRNGTIGNVGPFVAGDLDRLTGLIGGASKYLTTGWAGNAFSQDSFSTFAYVTTPFAGTSQTMVFGTSSLGGGNPGRRFFGKQNGTTLICTGKTSGAAAIVGNPLTASGLVGVSRNNPSTFFAHHSGTDQTIPMVSSAPPSTALTFFARAGVEIGNPRIALIWDGPFYSRSLVETPFATYLAALV